MGKATLVGIGLFAMALLLTGCSANVYKITVKLDPASMKDGEHWRTLDVDLIGVSEAEKAEWEAASIDSYFSAGNTMRSSAIADGLVKTLHFSNSDHADKTITTNDAAWRKWQEKPWLVVMAQLPPPKGAAAGPADRRRVVLPLDRKRWSGQEITITVRSSGLKYEPDYLPAD